MFDGSRQSSDFRSGLGGFACRLAQRAAAGCQPPVADALPGSTPGNRVLVLSGWLHYGLGNTLSQIVEVFNFHLQFT